MLQIEQATECYVLRYFESCQGPGWCTANTHHCVNLDTYSILGLRVMLTYFDATITYTGHMTYFSKKLVHFSLIYGFFS